MKKMRMNSPVAVALLFGLFFFCTHANEWLLLPSETKSTERCPYILGEMKQVMRSDYGEIHMLSGDNKSILNTHNIGLGYLTIDPKALLLPHYMDASFVFLVYRGSAKIGFSSGNKFLQKDLNEGDVYAIPAGTVFYLLNTDDMEKLKIYGAYDTSEALDSGKIQSFFVGGGASPRTVFSGFSDDVLGAAFKVSSDGVSEFLSSQKGGEIIPTSIDTFISRENEGKSWWSVMVDMLSGEGKAPKALNIFSQRKVFENENGKFAMIHSGKLPVIKRSRLGIFVAQLKAGSLMAPHWDSKAAHLGIVTNGSGMLQMSYPNGSNAVNKRIEKGDIFFVPRYYPVCEIACDVGLEFVGFTASSSASSEAHHLQFLTGRNSVVNRMDIETVALSFGMADELVKSILNAQPDVVILSGDNYV